MAEVKVVSAAVLAARTELVTKYLTDKKAFPASDLAGALINTGFSGKCTGIEFREVKGGGALPRTAAQGSQLVNGIVVAEVGDFSVVASLVFEDGRSVALSQINAHPMSTLTKLDGTVHPIMGITDSKDAFIGKTLLLVERLPDDTKKVTRRIAGVGDRVSTPAIYTWSVLA